MFLVIHSWPQVVVNGLPLELTSGALSGLNVASCEHSCSGRPCGPGTCLPHLAAFTCQCPPGSQGSTCETVAGAVTAPAAATTTPTTPAFTGDSFLFFNNQEIHQK